jgi:hypothetical protein
MSANVGTAPVQFYLGANPVSAYLGATAVARTMYFDGQSGDWDELGNWWLDSGHTVAAPSLPAAGDSVIATASIDSNSGGAVTVVNFTIGDSGGLSITITVTGNATFNDSSANDSSGTVTGNATFNGASTNGGTVTGTATFTGSACNDGGTAGTFVPDPPPSC